MGWREDEDVVAGAARERDDVAVLAAQADHHADRVAQEAGEPGSRSDHRHRPGPRDHSPARYFGSEELRNRLQPWPWIAARSRPSTPWNPRCSSVTRVPCPESSTCHV